MQGQYLPSGLDLNSQNARHAAPEPPHDFCSEILARKTDRYFEQQGVFGLAICDEIVYSRNVFSAK